MSETKKETSEPSSLSFPKSGHLKGFSLTW